MNTAQFRFSHLSLINTAQGNCISRHQLNILNEPSWQGQNADLSTVLLIGTSPLREVFKLKGRGIQNSHAKVVWVSSPVNTNSCSALPRWSYRCCMHDHVDGPIAPLSIPRRLPVAETIHCGYLLPRSDKRPRGPVWTINSTDPLHVLLTN